MLEVLGLNPSIAWWYMVVYACKALESQTGLEVQGHLQLYSKSEAIICYMRPYLKKSKKQTIELS